MATNNVPDYISAAFPQYTGFEIFAENTEAIYSISAQTNMEPNEVLNRLLASALRTVDAEVILSPMTHALAGKTLGAVNLGTPPPSSKKEDDPEDLDTRTPAERVAARRKEAGIA